MKPTFLGVFTCKTILHECRLFGWYRSKFKELLVVASVPQYLSEISINNTVTKCLYRGICKSNLDSTLTTRFTHTC